MNKPVIADSRMFPDLATAIKVLSVDGGLETFEYTETQTGFLTTPTQAQIQGLIIGAMRDLNPENEINEAIFDRISGDSAMQAAVLASHVERMAAQFPTNIAREGAQIWRAKIETAQQGDRPSDREAEVTFAGTSGAREEEE